MRPVSGPLIFCLLPVVLLAACDRQESAPAQPEGASSAAPATPSPTAMGRFDTSQRGAAMPTESFAAPDGKPVTLAAFKGKPLLVNLWATWCAPCVKEMPSLDRLAGRSKGKLQVLTVNQDSLNQAADPVPDWWAKAKLGNLALYRDAKNDLGFAFGGGLPTTVLYDAEGKEVWRINGEMDWDGAQAADMLKAYL